MSDTTCSLILFKMEFHYTIKGRTATEGGITFVVSTSIQDIEGKGRRNDPRAYCKRGLAWWNVHFGEDAQGAAADEQYADSLCSR